VSDGLNGEFFFDSLDRDWTSFFQSNEKHIKLGSE
jgi:hypothetical protein